MFICTLITAFVGIVGGLWLAIRTKKEEGIAYGKLDKAGIVVNIALILFYLIISPLFLFIGALAHTDHKGFLGILGWIVAAIVASPYLSCGLGLGASVALRKKGKSRLGFAAQFAGALAFVLMLLLFLFCEDLLVSLN